MILFSFHPSGGLYYFLFLMNQNAFYTDTVTQIRTSTSVRYKTDKHTIFHVDENGRFGIILPIRDTKELNKLLRDAMPYLDDYEIPSKPSHHETKEKKSEDLGEILQEFIDSPSNITPMEFIQAKSKVMKKKQSMNLLLGDTKSGIFFYSNKDKEKVVYELMAGEYSLHENHEGIENDVSSKPALRKLNPYFRKKISDVHLGNLDLRNEKHLYHFFHLLEDREEFPMQELPNTGLDLEWEKKLSPTFVSTPEFGTRSSLLVLITPRKNKVDIETDSLIGKAILPLQSETEELEVICYRKIYDKSHSEFDPITPSKVYFDTLYISGLQSSQPEKLPEKTKRSKNEKKGKPKKKKRK